MKKYLETSDTGARHNVYRHIMPVFFAPKWAVINNLSNIKRVKTRKEGV